MEPTSLSRRLPANVSNDGYISWDGRLYPVPMHLCLKTVWVEPVFGRVLLVYDERGVMVVKHEVRLFDRGIRPVHPEHEEINRGYREHREARRSLIVRRFVEVFNQSGRVYIEGLKDRVGPNLYWHLSEIMKYTQVYLVEDIIDVIVQCISIGAYHKSSVGRLLGKKRMKEPEIGSSLMSNPIPRGDIRRGLTVYRVEVAHE